MLIRLAVAKHYSIYVFSKYLSRRYYTDAMIMITWMRLVLLFIIAILLLVYVKEWGSSTEAPPPTNLWSFHYVLFNDFNKN